MLTWPGGWRVNALFALRWAHLISATAWLGLVLFFDRIWPRVLSEAEASVGARARSALEPVALAAYGAAALGTVLTGFADYVIVLSEEAIATRATVWLAAWTFASAVSVWMLRRSAAGKTWKSARAFALAIALWLALVAASGDWYMRRGGSHKAVALSLGGGLALVMASNVFLVAIPLSGRIRRALPAESPEWERSVRLAHRMNFWVSLAVLFLMGAASHLPFFRSGP